MNPVRRAAAIMALQNRSTQAAMRALNPATGIDFRSPAARIIQHTAETQPGTNRIRQKMANRAKEQSPQEMFPDGDVPKQEGVHA
jgi:hypothetical protein